MSAIEQFAALVTRRRLQLGWSKHELANTALMAESEVTRLEIHQETIGVRPVLALCAALGIPDGDAWALSLTGRLPGPLPFSDAQRILSSMGLSYPKPRLYAKGIRPRLRCALCGHQWKQIKDTAPRDCPRCQSHHWRKGLTPEKLATRRRRSIGVKFAIQMRKQGKAGAA